jgi:hypothetical protein
LATSKISKEHITQEKLHQKCPTACLNVLCVTLNCTSHSEPLFLSQVSGSKLTVCKLCCNCKQEVCFQMRSSNLSKDNSYYWLNNLVQKFRFEYFYKVPTLNSILLSTVHIWGFIYCGSYNCPLRTENTRSGLCNFFRCVIIQPTWQMNQPHDFTICYIP